MIAMPRKDRNIELRKVARYLFIGAALSILIAFALLYFEPPHQVQTISDFFHPERGSVRVTPFTSIEKIAFSVGLLGIVALAGAFVFLLGSFYSFRREPPII